MNESTLFLEQSQINNFDHIVEIIDTCGITPGTIAVEHVGDVLYFLERFDKKRSMDDPELKRAAFTLIKALIDLNIAEPMWKYSCVAHVQTNPPESQEGLFEFLDKYWYEKDIGGLGRNYLLFFRRKGQTWP